MATENGSFFSDPKVFLSLFALLLSIGNLIWSLANQHEQNRRWNKINAGSLDLRNPHFQIFKEISREEFKSTNWGYFIQAYGSAESTERVAIINTLRAKDPTSEAQIPAIDPVFTVEEMHKELARKNWKGAARIVKVYRPYFILKNEGKTDILDILVSVETKSPSGEWIIVYPPTKAPRLVAGGDTNIYWEFESPLDNSLPEKITFKLKTSFTDVNGERTERDLFIAWKSDLNRWVYE